MIDYTELSILFDCISLIEESWSKVKNGAN
jgi:hypothetical protein